MVWISPALWALCVAMSSVVTQGGYQQFPRARAGDAEILFCTQSAQNWEHDNFSGRNSCSHWVDVLRFQTATPAPEVKF
jgi:hypothetical protein